MKRALSKNKDEEQPSEEKDNDNNEPAASMVLNEGYILNKQNRDESNENEAINLLKKATSFSIEWKSLRGVTQCSCGSPIDYLTRKVSYFMPLFEVLLFVISCLFLRFFCSLFHASF